jgi:hypothetical protein
MRSASDGKKKSATGGSTNSESVRASIMKPAATPSAAYAPNAGCGSRARRRKPHTTQAVQKTATPVSIPFTLSTTTVGWTA